MARSKRPERPVAEKSAPAPAPIATKPKIVKRDTPVASKQEAPVAPARESETTTRRPIASTHVETRTVTTSPLKPFYQDDEALASARGGSRTTSSTRVNATTSSRQSEVRRAEVVERDEDPESHESSYSEGRSHRGHFFHRLFHGDDRDDD